MLLMWFAATSSGPVIGTFSRPVTFQLAKSRSAPRIMTLEMPYALLGMLAPLRHQLKDPLDDLIDAQPVGIDGNGVLCSS